MAGPPAQAGGAMLYGRGGFAAPSVVPGQERLDQAGALRFVVGQGAYAAEYDANGNMTSRIVDGQAQVLEWDAENRLVKVTQGTSISQYVYDGDGNRVKAAVNGVSTVYIGNYYEQTGSTVRTYYYHMGQRVAMREAGVTTWLLGDHLGSASVAYRASDGQTTTQRYYAWGTIRPGPSNTLPTDYSFAGQRLDAYLNLYEMGARWYDGQLGRWISSDTIVPEPGNPQSMNRYAYALNGPTKYVDPSGHWEDDSDVPYRSDWSKHWQRRWMREHGGDLPTAEQWAVMDQAWSAIAAFADHVGRPGDADPVYDWLGSVLSQELRQLPPGMYEVGVALGGSPIALQYGYLASDTVTGPDGMTWAYSGYRPANAYAWTLGNAVTFDPELRKDKVENKAAENHEYVHVLQYRSFGEMRVSYAEVYLEFKKHFGDEKNNPLETSAYGVTDLYHANAAWLPDLWDLACYRRR